MKPFNFVQFRIPAGKITDIYEKPLDIDTILSNNPFIDALEEASPHFWETVTAYISLLITFQLYTVCVKAQNTLKDKLRTDTSSIQMLSIGGSLSSGVQKELFHSDVEKGNFNSKYSISSDSCVDSINGSCIAYIRVIFNDTVTVKRIVIT